MIQTPPKEGLRERKKRKTRERIVNEAAALFRERGFDGATIADIAEAAEIAPRTFFSYFPSKEDVVFADFPDSVLAMHDRLRERTDGEDAVDAIRDWIATTLATAEATEAQRERRELINAHRGLTEHDRALRAQFQEELAQALRDEFDTPDGAFRAKLVAGAVVSVLATLSENPQEALAASGGDVMRVIDDSLAFVRGGIAALEAD